MKRILIYTTLSALIAMTAQQCGGASSGQRDATSTGKFGWIFEGCACKPNAAKALEGQSPAQYCKDDKKFEYLYMKFAARASQRAVQRNSIAMMQSTCRRAARDQASVEIFEKLKGAVIESASGVVDGESTGQAIITQLQGKVKGIGVYDCCPLNPETGECDEIQNIARNDKWKECSCVAYAYLKGGEKRVEAMAEELEAAQ